MDIGLILLEKVTEKVIDSVAGVYSNGKNGRDKIPDISRNNISKGLTLQTKKAQNFCQTISLFRSAEIKDIDSATVELLIENQCRHFYNDESDTKLVSELDILYDRSNHFILGDPGSGKTTTIKRLVKNVFEILFSEDEEGFPFSYPIVVKLGEIKSNDNLSTHLCKELGVSYETSKSTIEVEEEVYSYDDDGKTIAETVVREKNINEYKINDLPIENAISSIIDRLNIIIFLDGLDEVHHQIKNTVFKEIKTISSFLTNSKIIVTSRYLGEIGGFINFQKNEIKALSNEQTSDLASLYLSNPKSFFNKLSSRPYKDLIDRPLFLYLLLILYKTNKNELPEVAHDIYRRIILLVIKEWDDEREYKTARYSKYKQFDAYKKEDFLSEIAFHLTYEQGVKKSFNSHQLVSAFLNIYKRYHQFTKEDADQVISDIETHNGLIIKQYDNLYEFSHLSLQEYLCAKYLVTIPISRHHFNYINIAPSPLAIAVVLSPRPDQWFSTLMLNNVNEIQVHRQLSGDKIYEFLNRLLLEQAVFPDVSIELGLSFLFLITKFYKNVEIMVLLTKMINSPNVKESILECILKYKKDYSDVNTVHMKLKKNEDSSLFINAPKNITITKTLYNSFDTSGLR